MSVVNISGELFALLLKISETQIDHQHTDILALFHVWNGKRYETFGLAIQCVEVRGSDAGFKRTFRAAIPVIHRLAASIWLVAVDRLFV
ncbi:hypothetical protein D3C81_2062810 [compost metagenome]